MSGRVDGPKKSSIPVRPLANIVVTTQHDRDTPTAPASAPTDGALRFFPSKGDVVVPLTGATRRRLRITNIALFIFHASLALLMATANWSLSVPVYRTTLKFGNSGLVPEASEAAFALYYTRLTCTFFLISAVFHFGSATLWQASYITLMEHKLSPFRWLEYFFSASIMFALLAYPCGVLTVEALVPCVGLIATTMLFGSAAEWTSRPRADNEWSNPLRVRLQPHLWGYVPQVTAWSVVLFAFSSNATGENKPPDFVYTIVVSEFILFWSFGLVQLSTLVRPPDRYTDGEYAYQALSLVSKGLLGLILYTQLLFFGSVSCAYNDSQPTCE